MATLMSIDELKHLVASFENRLKAGVSCNHRARLALSLWHLLHYEETLATERLIRGLRRLDRNRRMGGPPEGVYHETLTLFWLGIAKRFFERVDSHASTLDLINGFLTEYDGQQDLIFEYYSKPTLCSHEARYFWVPPDLKPLI